MKPIHIVTVDHPRQRYDTCGDYEEYGDAIVIRVSTLGDWRYEALIAVHELVEKLLVNARGIEESAIDDFDLRFRGDEPGDDPAAPYHREHLFATQIERRLARELRVTWDDYDRKIDALLWRGDA